MERMLVSARHELSKREIDTVICAQGRDNPYASELRACGFSVVEMGSLWSLRGLMQFRRVIRSECPALVHVHSERSALPAILIARAEHVPVVRTIHNVFSPSPLKRLYRILAARVTDRMTSEIIACSPDVAANEATYGRSPRVIWNWVDERFFGASLPSAEAAAVLTVGNCSAIKQHDLVLRAALEVGVPVAHVGDESGASPEESSLLDTLDKRGLLLWRGVADPLDVAQRGFVFAMPSRQEGMPVALAEALVLGLPAMVADAPGLRWASSEPAVSYIQSQLSAWIDALRDLDEVASKDFRSQRREFQVARGIDAYMNVYGTAIASGAEGLIK